MSAKKHFKKLFTCSFFGNGKEFGIMFHAPPIDRKQVCRLANSLT